MISFAVQKLRSFIMFNLFIFAFTSIALGGWPKKTLIQFMSEYFAYVLFWEFYGVITYSSIYALLSLNLYMVWSCVLTTLVCMQLSNFLIITCLTACLLPIVYSYLLCQRLTDHQCLGLFLASLICFIDQYVCFCTNTMQFWL